MAATAIGPIGARQINGSYFVGYSDLTTIQKAVAAANTAGGGVVVIPWDYAGSDTIDSSVGSNSTMISDLRIPGGQAYVWYQSRWVPADFTQLGNISAANAHISGDVIVEGELSAASGVFTTCNVNGSPVITEGNMAANGVWPPAGIGVSTGSAWGASINPATLATWPPAGIGVSTGSAWGASINPNDVVRLSADNIFTGLQTFNNITAADASFDTCEVQNSPVRTFANTSDPEGPSYPPAGIGVSTGTSWLAQSINPADLPRLSTANTFALTQYCQQQFRAYGWVATDVSRSHAKIGTGNNGTSPYLGLVNASAAVNQRTWLIAAEPGVLNFTMTDDAGNDFYWLRVQRSVTTATIITLGGPATPIAIPGPLTAGNLAANANNSGGLVSPAQGLTIGWNVTNGKGETDFINSRDAVGGGGFNWYNVLPSAVMGPAIVPAMALDGSSNLGVQGSGVFGGLVSAGAGPGAPMAASTLRMSFNGSTSYFDSVGPDASTMGSVTFRVMNSTGSSSTSVIQMNPDRSLVVGGNLSAGGTIIGGGTMQPVNSTISSVMMGLASGHMPLLVFVNSACTTDRKVYDFFIDDGGQLIGRCVNDAASNATQWLGVVRNGIAPVSVNFFADLNASGAKNFRIPHPHNHSKELVHSSLEGPETAVFYRGEVTTKKGMAEVTLPDYFEALTFPEDRSVLLTQVLKADSEELAILAATRISEGAFRIRASVPSVRVAWEVKAVRRLNVDRLKVVDEPMMRNTPIPGMEAAHDKRSRAAR